MKTLAIALTLMAGAAQAQQASYYDKQGRFVGSSSTTNNGQSFYDRNGHFNGSTIRHGNQISVYDKQGRYQGSITQQNERGKK